MISNPDDLMSDRYYYYYCGLIITHHHLRVVSVCLCEITCSTFFRVYFQPLLTIYDRLTRVACVTDFTRRPKPEIQKKIQGLVMMMIPHRRQQTK